MDVADLLEWPGRADIPGMLFRRLIARHSIVGITAMTRAEQVLWLVFELCGEVSNGGLDQFFSNSSGDRAALVPAALQDLGRPSLAEAFARVAEGVSGDRGERYEHLEALTPEAKVKMEALEKQISEGTDSLLLELTGWIAARSTDFQLPNAGLAAFRPADVPTDLPLDELFAEGVGPEEALPALYLRWVGRSDLSVEEQRLQVALHAFGEVSDEGPVSYFFCRRGNDARAAQAALAQVGASEASKVLEQALDLFRYTEDLLERRARLAALDADTRAALGRLQWEMDDLRSTTLEALFEYSRRHRVSLR